MAKEEKIKWTITIIASLVAIAGVAVSIAAATIDSKQQQEIVRIDSKVNSINENGTIPGKKDHDAITRIVPLLESIDKRLASIESK